MLFGTLPKVECWNDQLSDLADTAASPLSARLSV